MTLVLRQHFRFITASLFGGAAILVAPDIGNATSVSTTGSASVTISTSGGVSSPEEPAATTNTVVTSTNAGSSSGFAIRTTPTPTATSNLGSSPVAPVAPAPGSTPAAGAGSSSSSTNPDGTPAAPRFSSPSVTTAGLGAASGVNVAGAPNQNISFMLPELTVYASQGQMVTLSNFQHTGGTTPFLGNDGSGFFNIGAQVNQSPISAPNTGNNQDDNENAAQQAPQNLNTFTSSLSDVALIGGDLPSILASAFTYRSPYVNIVVSYY